MEAPDHPFLDRGIGNVKVCPICCVCCCCFWTIFTVVAIPLSFKSLEQGKFALQLSWTSQQISEDVVVEPGMKFVGLGNMLVEYPSTFQTMYFAYGINPSCNREDDENCWELVRAPVRARSSDGLEMRVSISYQWKLEPRSLKPLYGILGRDFYIDEIVRFARAAIVRACTRFTAESYFTNRTQITDEMLTIILDEMDQPEKNLIFLIKGLQLREVDLPDEFDKEIASTREQTQEIEVATADREKQRIAMDRQMQVAGHTVEQELQFARGEASRTLEVNDAIVQQMLNVQRFEAMANARILEILAEDPEPYERLFDLMTLGALKDHESGRLLARM